MAERTYTVLGTWAPGPKSCGALAEITGWKVWPGEGGHGIDGETALRAWNKGALDVDTTCNIARLCVDSAALEKLLKDRRVAVRKTVLANPNCSWDTLASKMSWDATIEKSHQVRHTARRTLEVALHRAPFQTVLNWLHDGLPSSAYDMAAQHPNISDSEIVDLAGRTWTTQADRSVTGALLATRPRLDRYTDATLCALIDIQDNGLNREVATVAARQGRETVATYLLDNIAEENKRITAGHLAGSRNMTASFYQRLHTIFEHTDSGISSSSHQLIANPDSPWRLWVGYTMNTALLHAFGKALAEIWGDDPTAWRIASELADQLPNSTLGDLVDCVRALVDVTK